MGGLKSWGDLTINKLVDWLPSHSARSDLSTVSTHIQVLDYVAQALEKSYVTGAEKLSPSALLDKETTRLATTVAIGTSPIRLYTPSGVRAEQVEFTYRGCGPAFKPGNEWDCYGSVTLFNGEKIEGTCLANALAGAILLHDAPFVGGPGRDYALEILTQMYEHLMLVDLKDLPENSLARQIFCEGTFCLEDARKSL